MELLKLMKKRRSIRSYTGEALTEENLNQILAAGLLSPSGHNTKPWEFLVVRNKELLEKMTKCREGAANMLKGADTAIVVLADPTKTDVWTEDCSIAMEHMHLMADSMGIGSCWIQGRLRKAATGQTTEEYLREVLGFSENLRLEAVLSLGMPAVKPEPHTMDSLLWDRIHRM